MQVQVDIAFEQLVKIVKTLPAAKLRQLKAEIEKEAEKEEAKTDLKSLLLNGPVATKQQLETIENNRKSINQWRTLELCW
jgi:hypothetical protein